MEPELPSSFLQPLGWLFIMLPFILAFIRWDEVL